MENLDKLTAAGCSLYDLNAENLNRTDWSKTKLGPQDSWSQTLKCLTNIITTFPHAAAIFWGKELCVVHNLAWGKATNNTDGQGATAHEIFSGEALSSLETSVRGRTVKVACRFFLQPYEQEPDHTILLSTILDEEGSRQGVLAQLLYSPTVDRYLPLSSIDRFGNGKTEEEQNPEETKATDHPKDSGEKHRSVGDTSEDRNADPFSKRIGLDKMADKEKEGRPVKGAESQQTKGHEEKQVDSQQSQLFQRFAELLPNGLAILDSSAEAVFVNDSFFALTTNKTAQEFRAWPESIDPRDYDRVMDDYRKAFSSRQPMRVEFRCATSENEEWRLFLLKPLSENAEAGFICAVVDITEIKHAQLSQEKAAQEARDRKEQQERFIDMVSHEIRNPLSAVLHLAQEIKDVAGAVGEKGKNLKDEVMDILDAADTILLCVSHQNTLVDDILSFSKLDSMMLSLVPRVVRPKWDFSKALKVFNSEFKAKNIDFHYAMDVSYDGNKIDHVIADLNRMTQVLINLLTNAIKFTAKKDGHRKIDVSVGASENRPTSYPPNVVFFETTKEDFHLDSTMSSEWGSGKSMYLMVAIKDTGIGISAENQAKLFERFRQATPKTQEKYGGSGLGLFISRKLCQLHGGDIGVSSKEGKGSIFGFFFKVRLSDEAGIEDGRPNLGRSVSRASSDGRNTPGLSPRPSYMRSNSSLAGIPERPKAHTLASQPGVDNIEREDTPKSLENPPTEYREEAHPESNSSETYEETENVVKNVKAKRSSISENIDEQLPDTTDRDSGQSKRQQDQARDTSRSHSEQKGGMRPSLLLVEDNAINQKVLRRQLHSKGFEVITASNGQEAVDAVAERGRQEEQGCFDCILMDQEMPIKDGNQATVEIRELQGRGQAGRSPILGVSANVREAQTKSMKEAGMDDVISKPFKVDELVKRIQELLPERNQRQGRE